MFHSFVVLAAMRTGSNFLEANLNALDGVVCHGEAFNPHFIGYPKSTDILGLTRSARDDDPGRLLEAIRDQQGVLGGFRYFHDHDPRVLDPILDDPGCAKIILTRNPIESYVSRKIAAATGQWKLTNAKHAKSGKILFESKEFRTHLEELKAFQLLVMGRLQRSGQSAFYVDYEDLPDLEVMNGLAKWLGVEARLEALDKQLKKQNPEPLEAKVENFDAMEAALAKVDTFGLSRTPNFEPRRGPAVPTYVAAGPLLYVPVRSGPEAAVLQWMRGISPDLSLEDGFTQRSIRDWRSAHMGHRSFSVLRHPLARAHAAFNEKILAKGPGSFPGIRENLRKNFGLDLPEVSAGESYAPEVRHAALIVWLRFLKANLGGQTSVRVDPAWASQSAVLQGIAQFSPIDQLIRESEMTEALPDIAYAAGISNPPVFAEDSDPTRASLAEIYDARLEALARDVYARDYAAFGYGDWQP